MLYRPPYGASIAHLCHNRGHTYIAIRMSEVGVSLMEFKGLYRRVALEKERLAVLSSDVLVFSGLPYIAISMSEVNVSLMEFKGL